ncbi:MAG: response regulator [Burkholderiales bacterium]|nr:response regulator [Burkholderiales bacterium]
MSRAANVLLIDDNRMDIELTLDAFQQVRLSNKVHVVTSGDAALDYLFGRGQYADRREYPLPDLILLDLKMPGTDGFEVLRQVKSTPPIKMLPVVVLTSSREDGDRIMSYNIGANSYLVKPVKFGDFVEVVRKIDDYWLTLNLGPPLDN